MNLSDIPTPLTDAFALAVHEGQCLPTCDSFAHDEKCPVCYGEYLLADFARDLERKLAEAQRENAKALLVLGEVMGAAVDDCGLFESVTLLISQRENARNDDDVHCGQLKESRSQVEALKRKNAVLRDALELIIRVNSNTDSENREDDLPDIHTIAEDALAATEEFSSATTTCEHSGITFPTRP